MIQIGNKVKSKNPKGSFQDEGIIVALIQPEYFKISLTGKTDPNITWSKNFPNWEEKPVVLVLFKQLRRSATLEEWIQSGIDQGIDPKQCEKTYDYKCPLVNQAVFPYDDLQIVE